MEWEIMEPMNYKDIMMQKSVGPLLAKILCFSHEGLEEDVPLHDFMLFNDSQKVLDRIDKAIMNKEKVVIYGDYDCDGISATSIMVRAFEMRGMQVGFHIPDRFIDGYGLNEKRVEQMAKKGYSLIITVDNGVSAFDAVKKANELGMDVIITDHHDLPETLPEAYAIIHTQLSPNYPFKAISGSFVACKLACAMIGQHDPYIYCLAALSTISDMMPMMNENRTLVKKALMVMNQQKYLSFELLLGENQTYTTTSLGFTLAPKINSIGRLGEGMNPNKCVTYFAHHGASSENERNFKIQFASVATKMNQSRQRLTTSQYEAATKNMQTIGGALVTCGTDFHEGLVGLVAGKMSNTYYRPSFVVSIDKNTNIYKGSARSISGLDMHDILSSVSEDLLVFGGHQMAGGFSLEKSHWEAFLQGLENYLNKNLTSDMLIEKRQAILIEEDDIYLPYLKEIAVLEPFGQENEEPTFCLKLSHPSKIETLSGDKHLKMQFDLSRGKISCLWFNHGEMYEKLSKQDDFELFGTLSINKFRNFENIQMILKEIK